MILPCAHWLGRAMRCLCRSRAMFRTARSVIFAGGTPVGVETTADTEFRLTPEALRAAITPRTKCLILPYPNNPTGGIMEKADLEKIAQVVRETGILVISDEIYGELTYGDRTHISFASLPDMWQYTITLNGFSKAFAMTGWRVATPAGRRKSCRSC